jgi:DNA-binding response OmpR family regulator
VLIPDRLCGVEVWHRTEGSEVKRILVNQSDKEATQQVASILMEQGFEVEDAYDIEEALKKAKSEPWDLIILDIRVPQGDRCFDSFEDVREINTAPVVILSGLGQDEYIVRGLNAGADDYLVKPISAKVFLARVFALLRRASSTEKEGPSSGGLKYGDLAIDFDRHEVWVRDRQVNLTASEFRLLSYLAKNPGRVLTNEDLVREVQGYQASPQEAGELIKVHIHNLRKKLGLGSQKPPRIVNVRGVGYMFDRMTSQRKEISDQILA